MNKVQYLALLHNRGVKNLDKFGTVGNAVKKTGGEPSLTEKLKCTEDAMNYYIGKIQDLKKDFDRVVEIADEASLRIKCMLDTGIEEWEGFEEAEQLFRYLNKK